MAGETLGQAVERQAAAHVSRDLPAFAAYMTPRALVDLHRHLRNAEPRRFEVVAVQEEGAGGTSDVRYIGAETYTIRQRWERADGVWRAISAQALRPPRASWWRRMLGLPATPAVRGEEQR